jgi:phospholipid transport system substrate-binding protein
MNIASLIVLAALVGFARPVAAGEPTDVLKQRVDRVLRIIAEPGDHRAELRKVASEIFDWEEMSRRALGRHWNARTPEERRDFVPLFTDLLERAYVGRIESGRGGSVTFLDEKVDGDEATVRTRIVTPQRTEIPVDYRLHRSADGRWRVYDVNIEGVSLVANYRSQFNTVIQSESYAALVERLRTADRDAAASPAPRSRGRRD